MTTTTTWLGYRDGEVIATYASRAGANAALARRQVDAIAPEPNVEPVPDFMELVRGWLDE